MRDATTRTVAEEADRWLRGRSNPMRDPSMQPPGAYDVLPESAYMEALCGRPVNDDAIQVGPTVTLPPLTDAERAERAEKALAVALADGDELRRDRRLLLGYAALLTLVSYGLVWVAS